MQTVSLWSQVFRFNFKIAIEGRKREKTCLDPIAILKQPSIFSMWYVYVCVHIHTYEHVCAHIHTYVHVCVCVNPEKDAEYLTL